MIIEKCTSIAYSEDTPSNIIQMLKVISEEYPVYFGRNDVWQVRFVFSDEQHTAWAVRAGNDVEIHYNTLSQAARMTGAVLVGLVDDGVEYKEEFPFNTFGFMICAAHGKVFTVEHIKKWMRRLTLFGYNQVLLYMDDTFELEGEPFFGYLRGRYTAEEIREIDSYALHLGLELIPAIQGLGHMSQITQWPVYRDVMDTRCVVLVDEPRTYELLEKMVSVWKKNTHCQRIHMGMDEAHDLGRGVFLDKYGYENGFDIFNRHLKRVVDICKKNSFQPIIWSDMYFRMGSKNRQDYYDLDTVIPENVKKAIPAETQLAYWDYYHEDADFYVDWITRHRNLGKEPIMASAVWIWSCLWHDAAKTKKSTQPCIDACFKTGLKEILFTTWGDDGSYCDFDSGFAGFAFCAEYAFSNGKICEDRLAKRFAAVTGSNYAVHKKASGINNTQLFTPGVLWDDPIYHMYLHNAITCGDCNLADEADILDNLSRELAGLELDSLAGDLKHAKRLAEYLSFRLNFANSLFAAWREKDKKALKECENQISEAIKLTDAMALSFRENWLKSAKPFGLEVIQLRFAAVTERFRELSRRLQEYLNGQIGELPELDVNLDPPNGHLGVLKFSHLITPLVDIRI